MRENRQEREQETGSLTETALNWQVFVGSRLATEPEGIPFALIADEKETPLENETSVN